ncbi:hypothetical protein F2Q68_00015148 [Brassica cretica]|uniref:Retrotransposon gag domain-containing protein n=2 Tax=Brassica cretica TaxID=69181 RepID=A0A8S9HRP9_BRACR|nr:hypothetical protein F2Q68_00015148 [Brassica cretica]KAF3605475.1 hypothetical protein DY000_02047893 [Brassica cretica]
MENMDFGRTSIDEEIGISIDRAKAISIDKSTGISVDDAHQTSIDNIPPEAGKYSPTNDANERVVLGKPKERDNEWKLPLQDYLNPGRTYSNRSAIRLPKDDTKKFGISPEYLIMVRHPFRGTDLERPYDNIEYLEELINDEYNRCKFFPFSLEGDARKWLDQIPTGYLTCWKEIRSAFINQFFDEAHYWDARRKISTFRQNPWESFINAWERFKSYQLECPHHGYSEPLEQRRARLEQRRARLEKRRTRLEQRRTRLEQRRTKSASQLVEWTSNQIKAESTRGEAPGDSQNRGSWIKTRRSR